MTQFTGVAKGARAVTLSTASQPGGVRVLQALLARDDGRYAVASYQFGVGKVEEIGLLTTDVLTDPSDLASVDGARFYLVNRHKSRSALGRWLDDTFLLPRANVLYFDGMKFVTVAERINSPAGLALSPDGAHLYVAEDYPRTLASFARNDLVGSLGDPAVLSIPANPQKITVGAYGALIVTAKPKAGAGQVYGITVEGGVPQKAELLYSSKHEEVTGAAELGNHLLIGTKTKLLDCIR
jgi:hypothetical protein